MAIEMGSDEQFPLSRSEAVQRVRPLLVEPPRVFVRSGGGDGVAPIARGLPASPGVASGAVATTSAAAVEAAEHGDGVILVRDETSPEDVAGMAKAAGVLTARGGLASHAAVVARGWGIPAVVGAGEAVLALGPGERVSIDGSSGEVFAGELRGEWQVAPEAATLVAWAQELGIDLAEPSAGEADASTARQPQPSAADRPVGGESVTEITEDDVLRALAVKGSASSEQLAQQLLVEPAMLDPLLAQLVSRGAAQTAAGQLRLSAAGKLDAADLFGADHASLGEQRANELLDEFRVLDGRMKEIVTAWQVRDVAGEQVLNDHTDSDYDAGVLEELSALHGDTIAWLAPLSAQISRYAAYSARLERALGLARSDQRFVASPRVDSYHSVWFELHEDLIRLSGKTRSEATSG
jgi:pyruvate,orthophosphate dikinase